MKGENRVKNTNKQKLSPDIILKNYWNNKEQFADLFNAVLFQGKPLIKPEELEEQDTEETIIQRHRGYVESLKVTRDVIKIQKISTVYGVQFVLLGLENQEHIHYAMPLRVMGYDYGTYKKKYDENAKKFKAKNGIDEHEFLSRMKKTDKFPAVITLVIYYGEKKWDGARTLHEMLDIPEKLKSYVNDYKIHLIEACQCPLALQNKNNQDLFQLLGILLNRELSKKDAMEKAIQYAQVRKTEQKVIMTVASAVNAKINYDKIQGDDCMCTLFDEIAAEGRLEGEIKQLILMCQEFGISDVQILERLQKEKNLSLEKAQEYFEVFRKK